MKLTRKFIEKDGSGLVTLVPEDNEDMWHVYNLIQKGDSLKATTIRYVSPRSWRIYFIEKSSMKPQRDLQINRVSELP